jgi:hydrogenase maturation protease
MAAEGILIGLGNPIMSDDAIGILVAEKLQEFVPDFVMEASGAGGFDVVDRILGYRRAVIIDAMVTGEYPPGTAVRLPRGSRPRTIRSRRSHGINFSQAIDMAAECGAPVPEEITVYGIEVENPYSVGERISERILQKLNDIVGYIARDIVAQGK